ncbi:PHB depolymerase family esterase [Aquincola sp. MAHUQ-54]|uniref:PHB depolymerase family esterase n=1 Tax=Aquincola agrisoli TaxID=3119538 RepID=A0AAW9QFD8_9BURK
MNPSDISQTIDRALAAAGLDRDLPSLAEARATIAKALGSAGVLPGASARARTAAPASYPGEFLACTHANGAGSRDYKLYVPPSYKSGRPAPLIVMLHGCKQDPDDFAAGTGMNALADTHGFLVAYPAQHPRANGGNCWNWFEADQQVRTGAEPSLIAGIVDAIAADHAVDPSRVFVAGLSAGAAMAVILGAAYPEVFAGVAAHSGLPRGAAHDMGSAFAAMRAAPPQPAGGTPRATSAHVRTIVFHGDADATVNPANGRAIVEQAVAAFERAELPLRQAPRAAAVVGGRKAASTDFLDPSGRIAVREWVVQGGAHAWFGGSPAGSYTDASGPDASAEIVRFFLGQ